MRVSSSPWVALLLICSGVFCAFVSVFAIPPLIVTLSSEFHISFARSGLFMTAYTLTPTFGSLLIGFFSDRIGVRRSMLSGLALLVAAGILSSLTRNFWEMLACRILIGIGATTFFVPGLAAILRLFPPSRLNLPTGAYFSSLNLGLSVALFATPAIARSAGWRVALFSYAVLPMLLLTVMLLFTKPGFCGEYQRPAGESDSSTNAGISGWPLVLVSVGNFCLFFQSFAMITWLPEYLGQQRGYPPGQVGAVSMLLGLVVIPGSLFAGWLADRVGAWFVAISGALLCAICPTVLIFAPHFRVTEVSMDTALLALGTSLLTIPLTSVVGKLVAQEHGGKAVGLILTTGYSGAIVSTYLGGWLLTASGSSRSTFFMCSISMLLTLVLLMFLRGTYRLIESRRSLAGEA
jgi:predicted MFS family arabinose efflux permease